MAEVDAAVGLGEGVAAYAGETPALPGVWF